MALFRSVPSPGLRLSLLLLAFVSVADAKEAALRTGPVLGYVGMREAAVWVQTEAPSIVRVLYVDESGNRYQTLPAETDAANGNTTTLVLSEVEPGRNYRYTVEINGEAAPSGGPFAFKTPTFYHNHTPPPDLKIAFGSGHYVTEEGFEPPYQTLGGGYTIYDSILKQSPDLMIWLGNTMQLRESDWRSKSGYLKRYTHSRAIPELRQLLATVPNYATWGEHDYGTPAAGRYFSNRKIAEESFRAFWPNPPTPAGLEGIATRFRVADVDFFLLDVRTYRDDFPDANRLPAILGKEQLEWLRQELIHSDATFKVIMAGAPILNPAKNRPNLSNAEREHTALLQILREEKISGLLFASGGKGYGELTRLVHAQSYNLYDLTVGPLTANPGTNEDELNYFRMPSTSSFERHFATFEFTGPEADRAVTMRVFSTEGTELWNRTVRASQLQAVE